MEDINKILQGFALTATKIQKNKSYYICHTANGVKKISKTQERLEDIEISYNVRKLLTNSISMELSTQGTPYFVYNNSPYIVMDYIGSETIDLKEYNLFLELISKVGQMHKTLQKTDIDNLPMGKNLIEEYPKSLKKMGLVKKRINSRKKLTDLDVLYLKNYKNFIEDIEESIDILNTSRYDEYRNKAIQNKSICHNAIKRENIVFHNKEIYITHFYSLTTDYPLVDLANLIKSYVYSNANIDLEDVLDKYLPICDDEKKILHGMLLYPTKFLKLCDMYYLSGQNWVSNAMLERFSKAVKAREILKTCILST